MTCYFCGGKEEAVLIKILKSCKSRVKVCEECANRYTAF
jgi:protein-arginine kinase activator protein McsA